MLIRALIIVSLSGAAAAAGAEAPLFAADEALRMTIEAPMRDLIRNKMRKKEYDAIVRVTDEDGNELALEAKISARGNARLEACDFPPLRLELNRDKVVGTVFEGQKRLKMVTHCQRGFDGKRWVQQEYGIYRAYNIITDYSFQVRKLEVRYRDTRSKRWGRDATAFFIEAVDEMAERLGRDAIRPPEVRTEQYHLEETTNHLLFQYLIANTDFSVKRGSAGEGCCHNARVIAEKGRQDGWIVIPYDFDQAGIINTDYAFPDLRLGIRQVTSRLYRGFCWQNDSLPAAISDFNAKRDAMTAELIPADISESRQTRIRRYIERFYDTINDPEELQEELVAKCRGRASFAIRKTRTAEQ